MAAPPTAFGPAIGRSYDRFQDLGLLDEYYEHSDFLNFGYREPGTVSQREACEQLVDRLLDQLPDDVDAILDVACGRGATTRHLLTRYDPDQIVGINIAEEHLAAARRNAPRCTFLHMDATRLEFEDASFDAVICVEAAFHFDTRLDFLREARRVLRPGGRLVLSDIIFAPGTRIQPRANVLLGPHAYRVQCLAAGFDEIEIEDATGPCWDAFRMHLRRDLLRRLAMGDVTPAAARLLFTWLRRTDATLRHYLLVACERGAEEAPDA